MTHLPCVVIQKPNCIPALLQPTRILDAARRRDEVNAMLESGAEVVQALRMEHQRFIHASSPRAFSSSSMSGLSITESLWESPDAVGEPE